MDPFDLTEEEIRRFFDPAVYQRGLKYVEEGRVIASQVDRTSVSALVLGSHPQPYAVNIYYEESTNQLEGSCTCPYQWGWCKHIAAVLIELVRTKEMADESVVEEEEDVRSLAEVFADFSNVPRSVWAYEHLLFLEYYAKADKWYTRVGLSSLSEMSEDFKIQAILDWADRIPEIVEELDPLEQDLLWLMYVSQAAITAEDLLEILNRIGYHPSLGLARVEEAVRKFVELGVVLPYVEWKGYYFVPQVVGVNLSASERVWAPLPDRVVNKLEWRGVDTDRVLDVGRRFWEYVSERAEEVVEGGDLAKGELLWGGRVREEVEAEIGMGEQDKSLLRFLPQIFASLGLLSWWHNDPSGSRLRVDRVRGEQFWSLPSSLQFHWMLLSMERDRFISHQYARLLEERGMIEFVGYGREPDWDLWRMELVLLFAIVRTLPTEVWFGFHALVERVLELDPVFPRSLFYAQADWEVSEKWRGERGQRKVAYECVRVFLEDILAPMGIVTLGYTKGELKAFRLTSFGSEVLRYKASLSGEEEGRVLPLDRRDAQAFSLLEQVASMARKVAGGYLYRLNPDRVLALLEQGEDPAEVLAALRERGVQYPEDWDEQVARWKEGYGRLHLYDGVVLIECADEVVMSELLAATSLPDHLLHRFSPTVVAVDPEAVDQLVEEIRRLGRYPKV